MATTGLKTISRDQFMEVCPETLKKRIDDFFIYYSEKKKNPFTTSAEPSKKFYSKEKFEPKKKTSSTNFRKPFEKDSTELEKFFIDYKGVISKVNENNQEAIWRELLQLNLEKYITEPNRTLDENSSSPPKKSDTSTQKEIARVLYQYTRNCSMYLKEYVEIVSRLKKSKELSVYSVEYLQMVINDIDTPKENDKEYNILSHNIFSECTNANLITKKKFITAGLQAIHQRILDNLEEGESNEECMDILVQNMKRVGKQIYRQKEVERIIHEMAGWRASKTFSGRLHFNLIDMLSEIEKWKAV
jgi:hypothetical protein